MRNSQHIYDEGRRRGISEDILKNYIDTARITASINKEIPPLLTLKHLSHITDINVSFLRQIVCRDGRDTYRSFAIHKKPLLGKPLRKRFISIPEPRLMTVQKWISQEILSKATCHPCSVAYAPGSRLVDAANRHRGAKWIVKVDVLGFFDALTEIDAYRVFIGLGYQPIVSLELSRICTRLRDIHREHGAFFRQPKSRKYNFWRNYNIPEYSIPIMGTLPQGAPTSPMLANLAARPLDDTLFKLSNDYKVQYTRYADDLVFSTKDKNFGRESAQKMIGDIYKALGKHGLQPNIAKTEISSVGARKLVLGLLVDSDRPRLTRSFRQNLRMHLYYVKHQDIGPVKHARRRGFVSTEGLRQHLLGLIAFAGQIDESFADKCRTQLRQAYWP